MGKWKFNQYILENNKVTLIDLDIVNPYFYIRYIKGYYFYNCLVNVLQ